MNKLRALLLELKRASIRRKAALAAVAVLMVILIVALCININMRRNIQGRYDSISTQIGDALYYNLNWWAQYTDMTRNPNADLQNQVLPELREYIAAARTLNDLLVQIYGEKYRVLTEQDVNTIDQTLTAYDKALREGAPTDYAQQALEDCVNRVNTLLSNRFSDRTLKPAR